jgi:hypothetical protein
MKPDIVVLLLIAPVRMSISNSAKYSILGTVIANRVLNYLPFIGILIRLGPEPVLAEVVNLSGQKVGGI